MGAADCLIFGKWWMSRVWLAQIIRDQIEDCMARGGGGVGGGGCRGLEEKGTTDPSRRMAGRWNADGCES